MIKKVLIYIKSGGWHEVWSYFVKRIKRSFYVKSETVFLFKERSIREEYKPNGNVLFKQISDLEYLKKLDFPRLKTNDFDEWVKKGNRLIIGFYESVPVSYTWSHFSLYVVHNLCALDLSNDKCWIGPTFVDLSMRGKGINKSQISYQIKEAPTNVRWFVTSANKQNIASIKSFEKLGFKTGLILTNYYGIFASKSAKKEYFGEGKSIFKLV